MTYAKQIQDLREDIYLAFEEDLLGTADEYGIDEDEALNMTIDELMEAALMVELSNMGKA
mgnify:FL=1